MSDAVRGFSFEESVLAREGAVALRAPGASAPAVETVAAVEAVAPVAPEERIQSIDVLRGAAVLGILLLNINSFALPRAAFSDPSVYGGTGWANTATWLGAHVLFEGKMRAIFSMLFGASVIIMTGRAERRGAGVEVADVYYRRTLWLAVIGALHAYLIWSGDILFHYGVVGLILFPFRKLSGRTLCLLGAAVLALHTAQMLWSAHGVRQASQRVAGYTRREAGESVRGGGGGVQRLTPAQEAKVRELDEMRDDLKPGPDAVAREIAEARQGYLSNFARRARATASMQSDRFYRYLFWDVTGMLLLGMGLMKLGVFDSSAHGVRFYVWMAVIGYGVGLPLNFATALLWARDGFDVVSRFGYVKAPTDLARFTIAAGHVALVMLLCKSSLLPAAKRALANVGRMALTNYLLTSVLCTLLFYGYGLGLFGKLQRYELLSVVAAVWMANVWLSGAWLRRYRFGPAEWAWRSLTYWKVQPMRLARGAPAATVTAAA